VELLWSTSAQHVVVCGEEEAGPLHAHVRARSATASITELERASLVSLAEATWES
jgi:hypothetical protein